MSIRIDQPIGKLDVRTLEGDIGDVDQPLTQCLLCGVAGRGEFTTRDARRYFQCARCALVHLHPGQRISRADERARYELHQNDPADPAYVAFLLRLADPMMARLRPGAQGLDFGCGPAPVLSQLLTAAGFPCAAYDPFFAPDPALLEERYDFVTCSEVVEHAHDPAGMFSTLQRLLRSGSVLGVMTRFHPGSPKFEGWWYRRDPTHVCFYNETTMRWIAERDGYETRFPAPDVTLFTSA